MKIVLDTNVLLSGLMYPESTPGHIVQAWRMSAFDLVISKAQLGEIARVLNYPKIAKILKWDTETIKRFIKQLYLRSVIVEISSESKIDVPADPDDSPILASLVTTDADVLVTGDSDLLVLRDKYPIETPVEFADKL